MRRLSTSGRSSTTALSEGQKQRRDIIQRYFRPEEHIGSRPEERLVSVAHGVGPMIALGRPGEHLPQIGAARIYVPHADGDARWKAVVTDLCRQAGLVIIQIGPATPGLLWEIENVPKLVLPERLIIYLPTLGTVEPEPARRQFEEFLGLYQRFFPKPLPADLGDARCITFDREWNPKAIGPWSLPIRSNPEILSDENGLFFRRPELGLDDDTISLLSAVEHIFPDYKLPRETDLPFDLRVHRMFDVLFRPAGSLIGCLALLLIVWPDSISLFQNWLSEWIKWIAPR